jgi:uncharacterized protein (DUF1697 family)
MARHVAFLRAVNVGGHVVKMDHLRKLFESIGLSNVATFIASGNVLFDAPARKAGSLEKTIAARLHSALGYEVATFIRSETELSAVARYRPFAEGAVEATSASLYIGFLAAPLGQEARRKLSAFRTKVDEFHAHRREIYWLCRTRASESEFSLARFEKECGVRATLRNANTVRRIVATIPGLGPEPGAGGAAHAARRIASERSKHA